MSVRGAALFVGGCFALIAAILAVVPFSLSSRLNVSGLECRPPVLSAWNHGQKDQLLLWAVTVGTEMRGYKVGEGSLGPWCGDPARKRLLVSGGLVVGAGAVTVAGLRWRERRLTAA
jgi:hypothetical protein